MIIQSNLILLSSLLLDPVLLSCVQSLSARDNVDCTYANSTSSSYADLCLSSEFYPILPSKCHPSYRSLIHSEESYPGRTSSSVRFYGNSSFSVPEDLLAGLTGLKDYTIAVYFKEQVPNGTLFELNDYLAIRYTSEQQLEYFLPQLTDENRNNIETYNVSLSGRWKLVFFTFQDSDGDFSILTNFGSETPMDPVTSVPNTGIEFANAITSITIGEGFNGFLQDIRVYAPRLQTLNSQVIIPMEASFLPQCLCPSGYFSSQSETQCTAMDKQAVSIIRYDKTASTVEFSTDTSTTTMWQSNNTDTPVSLVVGLSSSISLSKIFITFSSSLPAKTTLQYYNEQASDWRNLQYFAENCAQSFEMGNDDQLNESFEVNCLQYTSNTTLTFLLAGTGSNARPLPSESETPFEVYYNASQVRLIMSGFMSSATNFAIYDIEICSNYCLDLECSCTIICSETAGMMSGDKGSGMSISDILMPSSTVPTALVSSTSTTSSVENNQGNSNTFVSIIMSASSGTIFISSSTQVQTSSSSVSNLGVTTSYSMQEVESSLMTTSQAVSQTSTESGVASSTESSAVTTTSSLIVGIAILGGIAALFAIIIITFILAYIMKKYRKRTYRPRFRDFSREEVERFVLHPINYDQQPHVYDYPDIAIDGPPLPPRRPLSKSFSESAPFAQYSESTAEASIVQQDEQPNTERRHTIIANMPLTDVDRVHSEANLSTCSNPGYSIVDDVVTISMHKNLAYTPTGLILANTHVQESSTPACTELTSEQDIASSESSSEDDREFVEPLRRQSQNCDSIGLLLRTDAPNQGAALTSAVHSGTTLWDTPNSGQQAEDQSCAIEVQHSDCDEDQSLFSHPSTNKKEPEHLSLQRESSSHTNNENQGLTLYERICGYERIHHIDIPLESLLQRGGTKPEDS